MKLKIINNKEYIFDPVRKKYVLNQPEEWVRQHTIQFLNLKKGYPISLMSIEKKIIHNFSSINLFRQYVTKESLLYLRGNEKVYWNSFSVYLQFNVGQKTMDLFG